MSFPYLRPVISIFLGIRNPPAAVPFPNNYCGKIHVTIQKKQKNFPDSEKVYLNGKLKGRHDNLYLANNRVKNWIFYEKIFVLERND